MKLRKEEVRMEMRQQEKNGEQGKNGKAKVKRGKGKAAEKK